MVVVLDHKYVHCVSQLNKHMIVRIFSSKVNLVTHYDNVKLFLVRMFFVMVLDFKVLWYH